MVWQICRSIRQEVEDPAKRMRFWRKMADAGGASTTMTMDDRHEPRAPVAIQMFSRDFGCRRHFGD
jgi:hypothetical protein